MRDQTLLARYSERAGRETAVSPYPEKEASVLESTMDIFFCDLCNESVPQADLDRGHAFRRKGRIICAACDQAMTGDPHHVGHSKLAGEPHGSSAALARAHGATAAAAAAPLEPPVAKEGGGILLGLLALLFAGGGFALMIDWVERVSAEVDTAGLGARLELARIENGQDALGRRLEARLSENTAASETLGRALRDDLASQLGALRGDIEGRLESIGQLQGDIASLESSVTKNEDRTGLRVIGLEETAARMDEDMRFFRDRLIEIEESVRSLAAQGSPFAAPSGAGAAAALGPNGERVPAWQGLLTDLSDQSPGIRLEAIYALGETRDSGVVPHLIPMLEDPDLFVRMASARILQDLGARQAAPNLIDALEDPQSAVREAAMVALRQITGEEFRFDPLANAGDRTKRVNAWRDWWKRSGEAFLAGS